MNKGRHGNDLCIICSNGGMTAISLTEPGVPKKQEGVARLYTVITASYQAYYLSITIPFRSNALLGPNTARTAFEYHDDFPY